MPLDRPRRRIVMHARRVREPKAAPLRALTPFAPGRAPRRTFVLAGLVGLLVVAVTSSTAAGTPPSSPQGPRDVAWTPLPSPARVSGGPTGAVAGVGDLPPADATSAGETTEMAALRMARRESLVARLAVPGVVRFRPRDGSTEVAPSAELSVRFTVPMDHASTEAAFRATAGDSLITGAYRWAEGDSVLVLRPAAPLPSGARVVLAVGVSARSAAGVALPGPLTATFTVAPAAAPRAAPVVPAAVASGWVWPLIGPITQYFGQSLTQYGYHHGLDIGGSTGAPVVAAHAGVVVVAGYADACGGLQVRVDQGGGVLAWYRHLSAIETSVGARVSAGTRLGRVGSTGCATGPHLHFGISVDGTFVDPIRFLPRR